MTPREHPARRASTLEGVDWELVTNFFIALVAITNPLSKIPLWVEGSADQDAPVRWRLALLVTATALAVLLVFLVGGRHLLGLFGIDLASFRIGGGIIILLVALDMLRGRAVHIEDAQDGEERDATKLGAATSRFRQVAVPLAMPIMAGPGSISTAVVFSSRADDIATHLALAATLVVVMVIMLVVLLSAERVERLVGHTTLNIQTRVFGMLLAGIAVQLIVEGLGAVFPAWLAPGSAIIEDLRNVR